MPSNKYYEEKMKAYQHELAAEFERARAEAEEMHAEARREFEKKLAELNAMQDDANRRARRLIQAGQESSRDIEEAISETYDRVLDATRNTMRRFSDAASNGR